jgi:hypothetical protein
MTEKAAGDNYQDTLFQHFQHGSTDGPWITSKPGPLAKERPVIDSEASHMSGAPVEQIEYLHDAITSWKKSERANPIPNFRKPTKLEPYGGLEKVESNETANKKEAERRLQIACDKCAFNAICRFAYNLEAYAGSTNKDTNMHYAKERNRLRQRQQKDQFIRCDYRLEDIKAI